MVAATKKSRANIRRLQKRAEARGETYIPPEYHVDRIKNDETKSAMATKSEMNATQSSKGGQRAKRKADEVTKTVTTSCSNAVLEIAMKLQSDLETIESNKTTNAKERRRAKKKAQAVASEESKCTVEELMELAAAAKANATSSAKKSREKKEKRDPYILFIGQLAYTTTKQMLFEHFETKINNDVDNIASSNGKPVTTESLQIRLLTDKKTKKSKGMAFLEVSNPELMYQCLSLHRTAIDGRRINVERSAGGGKSSEARKTKIASYRKEQTEYMSSTVDKILAEYREKGELEADELDEGVISLCKRHSAATIESSLAEYVEARGNQMDNPSAYLTHIIGRIATNADEYDNAGSAAGKEKKKAHTNKRPRTETQ